MNEITAMLNQWQLDEHEVRGRMYHAPSPRERERWHALWCWPGTGRLLRRLTLLSGTPTPLVIGLPTSTRLAQVA